MSSSRLPSSESFPYTLSVEDDREDTDADPPNKTRGWAELRRKMPTGGMLEYIQEQTTPYARKNPDAEDGTVGWADSPSVLWDFIETLRDDYYEASVDDTDELPLRVITHREDATDDNWREYDEYCEVYIRDPEGGEYVMWSMNELYFPNNDAVNHTCNSELIQKVLVTVAETYEEPQTILDRFGYRRTQVEQ